MKKTEQNIKVGDIVKLERHGLIGWEEVPQGGYSCIEASKIDGLSVDAEYTVKEVLARPEDPSIYGIIVREASIGLYHHPDHFTRKTQPA